MDVASRNLTIEIDYNARLKKETEDLNKLAEEFKKEADESKKIADESKKIADESKKIADELRILAAEKEEKIIFGLVENGLTYDSIAAILSVTVEKVTMIVQKNQ